MKTLALAGGDLVVGATGHQTISGARMIRQNLALHLGEDYGTDRFHPEMGSILPDFIGELIDDETEMLVRAEATRVVRQYVAIQDREVLRDHLAARSSRFDSSDVVVGVRSVSVSLDFDSIRVSISLLTQSGEVIPVNRTIQT